MSPDLALQRKIAIYTPSYSNTTGGVIALHKLCDILNRHGVQACLVPFAPSEFPDPRSAIRIFLSNTLSALRGSRRSRLNFSTNPAYETPVVPLDKIPRLNEEWIAIYPEVICGNPLFAYHVVRWFLHEPGFLSGRTDYGSGELYFRFREDRSADFTQEGSMLASRILTANDYPLHLYNCSDAPERRSGTAYCIRKGKHKPICHDLSNSILIDGKGHDEVARIFKSVTRFISYDTNTAYLKLAALCGCDVIVIPDPGVTEEQWKPNPARRYGVAYGFDRIEWARSTAHLVSQVIHQEMTAQDENVLACVVDMNRYFDSLQSSQ